ncbi:MAG TPA: CRISPR-associated endonuclease Cas2 [Nannocystis exedens]|nr:CRISPR-associated endonuclease Cas2 [Nannocystis exedens]
MAEPRHWYLITYDVSDPKALRRTHRTLRSWGKPVQYSIFRVRCSERQIQQLRFELANILDSEDRLMIVRLCESCASRVTVQGHNMVSFDPEPPPFEIL